VPEARYSGRVESTQLGAEVAAALGILLQRRVRSRLYGRLTEGLDPALDEMTYPVISGLERYGPLSAADLGARIGIDRTVTTRRASRLEAAGLIRRTPDEQDRRATLLELTEVGRRHVQTMRTRLAGTLGAYLATWPPGQAEAFVAGLRRFTTDGPVVR
jgi:DNA-binding MarR family transcriptional regulator